MQTHSFTSTTLEFYPLTIDRWADLESLFGSRGPQSTCWCLWWRVSRAEFEQQGGAERKQGLNDMVRRGGIPGILGYADDLPVAWCSIAPREQYASLERSRVFKRIDDRPVWAIVCVFINKAFRHQKIMVPLLSAAIEYAKSQGATIVEGYPVEPEQNIASDAAYMGIASAFREAGFKEIQRKSNKHVIMRYSI